MPYELAKQLKDAGFPQTGEGHALSVHGHFLDNPDGPMDVISWERYVYEPSRWPNVVYRPTLEELIEACAGEFWLLRRSEITNQWDAQGNKGHGVLGSNPTEAVAKLWLALHKKV